MIPSVSNQNGPVLNKRGQHPCIGDGCCRDAVARGMCLMHYKRWRKHGDPNKEYIPYNKSPISDRLSSKYTVNSYTGCWEWTGAIDNKGYGIIHTYGNSKGRAHRVSWEITHGEINNNLCVCHSCDNPKCINPDHLFLGTIADNNRDMAAKGRNRWSDAFLTSKKKSPQGERHGMSKLNTRDVIKIRNCFENGVTMKELAILYDVGHSHICSIVRRKSWRHI